MFFIAVILCNFVETNFFYHLLSLDGRTIVRYRNSMLKDNQYLLSLKDYYARHSVLPSYASIAKLVGLKSKASVADLVNRLKSEGFLESSPDRRLVPGKRFFEYSISDGVRAGLPASASDFHSQIGRIDDHLVPRPARTVLIKVKGDSMIDAGIHNGDVVIVEKRSGANTGEIVIAILDNEFTLKRLGMESGKPVLFPENKMYPTIRMKGNVEIFGVVIGMFRKY